MQQPLSHHRILELVAPFSRAGWAFDLAASDRAAGTLVFRPVAHEAAAPVAHEAAAPLPALTETRTLHGAGRRLVRELRTADGLVATLEAEGDEPAALLAAVAAVGPARQFCIGGGFIAALQQRCGPNGTLVLRGLQARVAGLQINARLSSVRGYPADLQIERSEADARRLPDDLLQVLGRAWGRLTPLRTGWEAAVQLAGAEPRRSADAEAKLSRTLAHIAHTLAEPPAQFHQRHLGARWRVGVARAGPLSVGLAVVAVAVGSQALGWGDESVLALLANAAPPLLMAAFFMRREMPRIELPRVPRQPPPTSWAPWTEPSER
jgi:hypothetical protein